MKNSLSLAIAAIAAAGTMSSGTIHAANSVTTKAEQILITATRTEQSYASTLAAVTVFNREEIEKFQARSLAEILTKAAGINFTRTGGRGSVTGISVRGNQTDHSLFLIDGVRVGSSTLGSTAVALIDPELIDRIEIVRGPKSSLYGSDALGGVINIITRKADNATPLTIKTTVSNNNGNDNVINFGQRGDNYHASLTASSIYLGGIDNTTSQTPPNQDDDAFRQNSLGFNGGFSVSQDLRLGLSYQLVNAETEYDNNCTDSSTFLAVSCSPYIDNKTEALNASIHWDITPIWSSALDAGISKDESETLADEVDMNTTFSGGIFNTKKTDINWLNNFKLSEQLLLTVGYDFLNEKVSGSTAYDVQERDNDGYFAQLQFAHGPFSANAGARNDENEQFGSHDTYNLTAGYNINKSIKIIASYGEAFKAPTFNDLYFPNFGDPTMVPEETDSYELALRGLMDSYDWTIRLYQNNVENLIQYNSAIFSNDQIASATIEGLEFSLQGELYGWSYSTAITLLDTEDDATGNELARRPDKTLNFDIDKTVGDWSFGASWYAASSRFDNATNSSEMSGYGTVGLRTSYAVHQDWQLQLKADNIFEKDYILAQASSFSGLGDYQQPGLEVFLSVIYRPH